MEFKESYRVPVQVPVSEMIKWCEENRYEYLKETDKFTIFQPKEKLLDKFLPIS